MAKKKVKYIKKSFESVGTTTNDVSSNIYMSMLTSNAWENLSTKQQQLYVYCKAQYYGQSGRRAADKTDNSKFYFNRVLWQDTYKLYKKGGETRFYKDMSKLIENGFIKCIKCGKHTRTKSIYQFSNKWQYWNTTKFELVPSELNSTLLKKYRTNK